MWTTRQGRLAIVFAVLAGAAWWLLRGVTEEPIPRSHARTPNHVVLDFNAIETDGTGQRQRHLVADQMRQYSAEDLAELDRPHLTLFDRDGAPPWDISAQRGFLLSRGEEVQLLDQVRIERAGLGANRSFRMVTAQLRLWPKREYAQGDQPVRLTSDRDWLSAAGVRLWYARPSRAEFPGRVQIFVAPAPAEHGPSPRSAP